MSVFIYFSLMFLFIFLFCVREMRRAHASAADSGTRALIRHTWPVVEMSTRANQVRPGHRFRICSGREDGCCEERKEWTAGESED